MNTRERWSQPLILVGFAAMLLGALDPLEGSLVILPGSALVALGTYFDPGARHLRTGRTWSLILIAGGIGAMWGLSAAGGLGGKGGASAWWGLLLLPYLAGWLWGIQGGGSPRWVRGAGILVGGWYLALSGLTLLQPHSSRRAYPGVLLVFGVIGLVLIGLGLWRLRRRSAPHGASRPS